MSFYLWETGWANVLQLEHLQQPVVNIKLDLFFKLFVILSRLRLQRVWPDCSKQYKTQWSRHGSLIVAVLAEAPQCFVKAVPENRNDAEIYGLWSSL